MSAEVRGIDQLVAELERRFGKEKIERISDKALIDASKEFVNELKRQFELFKDTGGSIEEITTQGPMTDKAGNRVIKVHWRGPRGRYRIIHLNEWGTVKNPNPRGKGAVARAMKNSEKAYRAAVRKALESGL